MRLSRAAVLLLALLLAGCAPAPEETVVPSPKPEPVRFLAFGDYGFGNAAQNATARGMERVCAAEGCDLGLLLGDNVYPEPPADPRDPAFDVVFERPYANLSMPFYAVMGNHDRRAGGGDVLLEYANRTDRATDRWRMPARSYAFSEGDVLFVALDMSRFYRNETMGDEGRALLAWLDNVTRSPEFQAARWRVAFAHFPYLSNGRHGAAGAYDGDEGAGLAVARLVERGVCGKFDLYLAGHDHDLEWLAPAPRCAGTELVVSGAAGEARPLGNATPALFQRDEGTGFFWFEAREDRLVGRAYDGEGNVLFERAVLREARAEAASSLRPRTSAP